MNIFCSIETTFRYNIYHDNKINLYLHNQFMMNYLKLDRIFYRLIFKYVSPKYLHLFYQEFIDLSFGIINYRNLADKLCSIDKHILNSNFRYYNFIYGKENVQDDISFLRKLNEKKIDCLKYINYSTILNGEIINRYKDPEKEVLIEILSNLYEKYRDKIIIKYVVYCILYSFKETEYNNFSKDIVNKIDHFEIKVENIDRLFTNFNNERFSKYFIAKKKD